MEAVGVAKFLSESTIKAFARMRYEITVRESTKALI